MYVDDQAPLSFTILTSMLVDVRRQEQVQSALRTSLRPQLLQLCWYLWWRVPCGVHYLHPSSAPRIWYVKPVLYDNPTLTAFFQVVLIKLALFIG